MAIAGVYQIKNKVNNKIYVGSTSNLEIREVNHFSSLKHDKHYNIHLQRSYNKYGKENFVFEVLFICSPESLLFYEQQFLDQWKPEYNISINALAPTRGRKLTEEHKQKVGIAMKGHENYFIKHSEETKQKISKSMKGYKKSKKHRENLSKALKGNKNGLGNRSRHYANHREN